MDFIVLLADWTLQIVTFATVEAGFEACARLGASRGIPTFPRQCFSPLRVILYRRSAYISHSLNSVKVDSIGDYFRGSLGGILGV